MQAQQAQGQLAQAEAAARAAQAAQQQDASGANQAVQQQVAALQQPSQLLAMWSSMVYTQLAYTPAVCVVVLLRRVTVERRDVVGTVGCGGTRR